MRVYTIWGMREGYPTLHDAWDAGTIEDNPDGFAADVERARVEFGSDVRIVVVKVNSADIRKAFDAVETEGKVGS